tara:strand:+ start:5395 stop:6165 length:771 start_codon:yes stop_codon:yes gene_type:complete
MTKKILKKEELPDCCKPNTDNDKESKKKGIIQGIIYGTIPHIGCIMFIIGAVLGATILMQFFRPLLMNRYIFHYLIGISFIFATISSFLYLRKHKRLSWQGIKSKKAYLSIMYGSTIGINLILFLFIFPLIANVTSSVSAVEISDSSLLEISVDIPCPGHAPLITSELKTINGVKGSEYSFPNDFEVYYDSSITSEQEILSLEVFEEYSATIIGEEQIKQTTTKTSSSSAGTCGGGCGGAGSCGGSCGSPTCSYNK